MFRLICVVLGTALLIGCPVDRSTEKKLLAINGFVLGGTEGVAKPLLVGVGDSVQRLVQRNAFLGQLRFDTTGMPLRLPLMTKVDVTYDDGDMRLKLGCATGSSLDGNNRFKGGITLAGFDLCNPAINDWTVATRQASQLIEAFKQSNPNARDLKEWLQTASKAELAKLGGENMWRRKSDIDVFSESEANARFAALPVGDAFYPPLALTSETLVNMGYFAGAKAIFLIGVSKYKPFGGTNLSEAQRKAIGYRVGVSFTLRADVEPGRFDSSHYTQVPDPL